MKKLQPKLTNLTAESQAQELEATFQKLSKPETTTAAPKKRATASRKNARKPRNADGPPTKREGKTRVTVDVPDEIYALVEKNKDEVGQSFTHLINSLLKKHFAGK